MIVAAVLAAAQEARNPIPPPIVPQPIPSHSTMESKVALIADAAPESLDGGSKANDSAPVTGIEQTTKKTVSALDAKERSRANEGTIEAPKTSTKASTESDGVEKGP